MYLMFYINEGKRIYTLEKVAPDGQATISAHPARFSPEDQYSRERILIKKRFNLFNDGAFTPAKSTGSAENY